MPSNNGWDLVRRDGQGSLYSNSNASSSGALVVRDTRPRVQLKVEGPRATYMYKGPDGSATTDKALEIALLIAMGKKCACSPPYFVWRIALLILGRGVKWKGQCKTIGQKRRLD